MTALKTTLSFPDLSLLRKISRLCLFHKIYHHNKNLRQHILTQPSYVSSRVDHQNKDGIPHCNSSHFYQSFVPMTSLDWNRLSAHIVRTADSAVLKAALGEYLFGFGSQSFVSINNVLFRLYAYMPNYCLYLCVNRCICPLPSILPLGFEEINK